MTAPDKAPPSLLSKTLWRRIGQAVIGITVGLVVAEMMFTWRMSGAFPHMNLYIEDAQLGVRLEPGGEQKLRFRDNPLTHIRINDSGYRGENFPARSEDEILVVGDSQVFGLGVDENETFSAQLAALSGRTVLNGGVPTYGPSEYTAVARELIAKRNITSLIYVVNFANDLFELERPNKERHEVWDGWAVRSETAPQGTWSFPGRHWLMNKSHLVYTMRRWLHDEEPDNTERGFASEGTWTDLVATGNEAATAHTKSEEKRSEARAARRQRLAAIDEELTGVEDEIDGIIYKAAQRELIRDETRNLKLQAARRSPGDIVSERYVEAGRSLVVTADLIRRGVRVRDQLEERLKKNGRHAAPLRAAIDSRAKLRAEQATLLSAPISSPHVPSVLRPELVRLRELCRKNNVDLTVVALPIDVQVDKKEWLKYGVEDGPDMTESLILLRDLTNEARRLGLRSVDVTQALASVEGPAFLNHDIHMTPAGHAAFAKALWSALQTPAPIAEPDPNLATGRTRIPPPDIWNRTREIDVRGSSKARCETVQIAEWFRATCKHGRNHIPTDIVVTTGGHGEASVLRTQDAVTLIAPILEGDDFEATFYWKSHHEVLKGARPKGAATPVLAFGPRSSPGKSRTPSPEEDAVCACYKKVEKEKRCQTSEYGSSTNCRATCQNAYGAPTKECLATYGQDCAKLLACIRGDTDALATCETGHAIAGGAGQCFKLCRTDADCSIGACTPTQGTNVCR